MPRQIPQNSKEEVNSRITVDSSRIKERLLKIKRSQTWQLKNKFSGNKIFTSPGTYDSFSKFLWKIRRRGRPLNGVSSRVGPVSSLGYSWMMMMIVQRTRQVSIIMANDDGLTLPLYNKRGRRNMKMVIRFLSFGCPLWSGGYVMCCCRVAPGKSV